MGSCCPGVLAQGLAGRRARASGEQRVLLLPARVLASWQIHLHVALEHLGTLERAEVVSCRGDGTRVSPAACRQLQSPDAFGARAWTQQEVSPKLPACNCHVAIVSLAVVARGVANVVGSQDLGWNFPPSHIAGTSSHQQQA